MKVKKIVSLEEVLYKNICPEVQKIQMLWMLRREMLKFYGLNFRVCLHPYLLRILSDF
ncbi:hypothetical protein C1752_07309 [Acaryochloris thomasi RCC1774]|uniref:Uncharacterized protein n=1 Tax=Acaryochloris thomasi RCC1774 TaxID=1764569 RepID=A0A2W1JPZ4_9CYAN|nr:hypothetical protein C1752_07309 [Acaryochloris thomasi RCC1774]